jgi:DNA (cytosine-5)-methyltransferase 1
VISYSEHLENTLHPQPHDDHAQPLVLDLFAGCGGLALGFEAQGFRTLGFEMDADCCATYRHNLLGDCVQIKLDANTTFPKADVVIGGPPCQPFSVGGNQNGLRDARDGFPAFISAIRQAQPAIWMFENVRGLMYRNKDYLELILRELEVLGYVVEFRLLNAVHYGVPQNRERVIVVGHRGVFHYPTALVQCVTAGEALAELATQVTADSKFLTPSMDQYVAKYEKASCCITPRDLHLHRPARTVTCRNLAGATGDMHRIVLPDGRRRRLTVREGARLQSFPDWFAFQGSETSCFNQIGNAVPPLLAYHLAGSFRDYLESPIRSDFSITPITKQDRTPVQLSLLAA